MNLPARNSHHSADQQPEWRRMHPGLKAIRECLQTLEGHFSWIKIPQCGNGRSSVCEEQINVYKLRSCLADANDLRQLMLLQLRQFNRKIQIHLLNNCCFNIWSIIQRKLEFYYRLLFFWLERSCSLLSILGRSSSVNPLFDRSAASFFSVSACFFSGTLPSASILKSVWIWFRFCSSWLWICGSVIIRGKI